MEFTLTLNQDLRDRAIQIEFVGPNGYDSHETHAWTTVGYSQDTDVDSPTVGKYKNITYFLPKPGWVPHTHGQVMYNETNDESLGEVVGTWTKNTPDNNVMCDKCNRIIKNYCFYCCIVTTIGNLDRAGVDFVAVAD